MAPPRARRGLLPSLGALILILTFASASGARDAGQAPAAEDRLEGLPADQAPRPNILTIMVDDQELNSFKRRYMPHTFSLLGDQGTRFSNAYAVPPLCCPSRAGFQTGQYPHNHGVLTNSWTHLREPDNILSSWLDNAGYETGFVGKYMNGYNPGAPAAPAPGFDEWWGLIGKPGYFRYRVSVNGRLKRSAGRTRDYTTSTIVRRARHFIEANAGDEAPFFLWTSIYAPHFRSEDGMNTPGRCVFKAPMPHPRDMAKGKFRHTPLPAQPNFAERNRADKPATIRHKGGRIRRAELKRMTESWQCTLESLQAVDRGVADLYKTLKRTGELKNTVIVYLSDNGYFWGQMGLTKGKKFAYDPAARVPLIVRVGSEVWTNARRRAHVDRAAATIDLAPTFLELAGAKPCTGDGACRTMDGRSLVDLLRSGADPGWPAERPLLFELGRGCEGYRAVRTVPASPSAGHLYVEWQAPDTSQPDGCGVSESELYGMDADPFQLRNLLAGEVLKPGVVGAQAQLAAQLERLKTCSGIQGRDDVPNPCL